MKYLAKNAREKTMKIANFRGEKNPLGLRYVDGLSFKVAKSRQS